AADSSNYRQLPIGVVLPRDAADVEAAIAACRATGAAVLSRGAGTSLAGQCANVAVIIDFSRYMNRLHSIDPEKKLAVVDPGIVLDRVREAAELHQLTYAPDPATHSRCTLGGMIGNNSCGVHGLLGGKVSDNIESLDIVLYDGTRMTVGRTSDAELDALIRRGGRVGQIYAGLAGLRDRYADLVRKKFPRIPRRVSGYNLDELLSENGFHVARALVGSEGTCVTVLSATLNLRASPPHRVLTTLAFPDAFLAADAVPQVLEHKPIGLEGFDAMLVDFMRRKHLAVDEVGLLPPGGGFLLVEMGAWDADEAQHRSRMLVEASQSWPVKPQARIYSTAEAARVWFVRENALGATVFVPGEPEGWEGWEDGAVPPEKLGAYLRGIDALMKEYGYRSSMYGHYGQGCVHMRINFDFHSDKGLRDFRQFIDRAADLVLSFGGSLSGEHGDGQSRGALLPKMFGPELMEAFREFKGLWDPENRMNPGKVVDPVRVYDPVENLRHLPQPGGAPGLPGLETWELHFAFAKDGGSLERATERCVGVGACRKASPGVMCPSYRATGDEQHSTRGRARLLWEMLAGDLRSEGFRSEAVREALDLCLSCKACKSECPVSVDMAAYKAEFLAQHYKGRLHPLSHYTFGYADKLARWGSLAPALTNAILTGPLTSPLIKRIAGVAQQRQLPKLAPRSFVSAHEPSAGSGQAFSRADESHVENRASAPAREGPAKVLLWPDTWNNYYHPQTLSAAETVLREAGFEVIVPAGHICCGRPLYDFGHLDSARAYLADVLDRMSPHIAAGLPFIFLEPSCASVFKDELPELFPDDPRANSLREQVWLLADWLAARAPDFVTGRLHGAHILIHGHCHHKAVFGGPKKEIALLRQAGATVEPIEAGCCGMAGPFGFEADKFDVSQTIARQGLLPAIESAAPATLIVADGFSCREQILQLGHKRALHFAEALALRCGCDG
ncbi:MAG TPA: FAD-binding and (Fe-S)-binding domain-containing protein, partial [Candidatus Sulfopaludibacter sp.]|nr:FAD-binding and (Fe-S)-binding domain-containing protein [Candidatus Sulfopaludibacter sp.]